MGLMSHQHNTWLYRDKVKREKGNTGATPYSFHIWFFNMLGGNNTLGLGFKRLKVTPRLKIPESTKDL